MARFGRAKVPRDDPSLVVRTHGDRPFRVRKLGVRKLRGHGWIQWLEHGRNERSGLGNRWLEWFERIRFGWQWNERQRRRERSASPGMSIPAGQRDVARHESDGLVRRDLGRSDLFQSRALL